MKNIFLLAITFFVLTGCVKQEPKPKIEPEPEVVVPEQQVYYQEEEPKKIIPKKKKRKVVRGTYYKIITSKIETFYYKGSIKYIKTLDEKKLRKPFYLKGNYIQIEKIYKSKLGDRYGKIVGKSLFVSMDDLIKR